MSRAVQRQQSVTNQDVVRRFAQYSCLSCRSKKIKCDNVLSGCSNCRKAKSQCIYVGRRPRKALKHSQSSLVRQLLPFETATCSSTTEHDQSLDGDEQVNDYCLEEDRILPSEVHDPRFESKSGPDQSEQGRLFVASGKSRYVNGDKARQLANLEEILSGDISTRTPIVEDDGDSPLVPPSAEPGQAHEKLVGSLLLGSRRARVNLKTYHPSNELKPLLWGYYVRNVDFFMKILYRPTVEAQILETCQADGIIEKSTEVLLFAIWFATVITMTPQQCLDVHGIDRNTALAKYYYALQESLFQVDWMMTRELEILQAIVIFMACSPGKNTRSTWTVSGIAIGIAQAMGLHRDSAPFSLSPIQVEVRRRVWWTLCTLDYRVSDACGLEIHVPFTMNTALPTHTNDADIPLDATQIPQARDEFTEMTVTSIKAETARAYLRVRMAKYANHPLSRTEIETIMRTAITHIEGKYMMYLDGSIHLHQLCYLCTQLILTKLWGFAYHNCTDEDHAQPQEVKDRLLYYNAEVLEIAHRMPDDSAQFGWWFNCKSMQWHAMAYLLVEVCRRTPGPAIDRAWVAIDAVLCNTTQTEDRQPSTTSDQDLLWHKLVDRARCVKAKLSAGSLCSTVRTHSTVASVSDGTDALASTDWSAEASCNLDFPSLDPFLGWVSGHSGDLEWEQLHTVIQSFDF